MIEKFNSKVGKKDLTYFLGDFSWSAPAQFLDRLNGEFVFIRGNHDKQRISHPKILKWVDGYQDIKVPVSPEDAQKITLCHYPMRTWNCSHYNAWELYGHHHTKTDFGGKTLNCSVDNLDYNPISLSELIEYMSKRENNWDFLNKYEKLD